MEKKKRKKKSSNVWVYQIKVDEIIRYVGISNNIKLRTSQHNRGIRRGDKKLFYDFCRECGITTVELIPLIECKDRTTAKRWEMYMILDDWSKNRELKQVIPGIR